MSKFVMMVDYKDGYGPFILETYEKDMGAEIVIDRAESIQKKSAESHRITFFKVDDLSGYIERNALVLPVFKNDVLSGKNDDPNGPILMEAFIARSIKEGPACFAGNFIRRINGRYGDYKLVKLTPVDKSVLEAEVAKS